MEGANVLSKIYDFTRQYYAVAKLLSVFSVLNREGSIRGITASLIFGAYYSKNENV